MASSLTYFYICCMVTGVLACSMIYLLSHAILPCLHTTSKCTRHTCSTGSCRELYSENIFSNIHDIKCYYPSQASNNATKAEYVKSWPTSLLTTLYHDLALVATPISLPNKREVDSRHPSHIDVFCFIQKLSREHEYPTLRKGGASEVQKLIGN